MLRFILINNKVSKQKFNNLIKIIDDDSKFVITLNILQDKANLNKYLNICIKNSSLDVLQELMTHLCKTGDLKNVKQLQKKFKENAINFDLNFEDDILFRKSCTAGNLQLIKYLINESRIRGKEIDINTHKDNPFKRACKYNNNQVVKYLYYLSIETKKPININLGSNYCFRIACRNGNEFLVKFLYKANFKLNNTVININNLQDQAFRWACEGNHYNIAKYLWKISKIHKMPINTKYNDNEIFMNACANDYINIVNLLMQMTPNYYYANINDNKIIEYGLLTNVRKSLNILQENKKCNPCNILGIKKTTTDKKNNECNICYSNINDITSINNNNKLVKLECSHTYCLECLLISYNQQIDDDGECYNYNNNLKCFNSGEHNFKCLYCKKNTTWKDCIIMKKK